MDIEIPKIKKAFQSFVINEKPYDPKFAEITINKRIDDRFFYEGANPKPGTIIST